MIHNCLFVLKENLALKKPTWQKYPWPDKTRDFGSENAVDGLYTDCSQVGGQCTINDDGKYLATWRVDLGEVFSISHINIYYRTDNKEGILFFFSDSRSDCFFNYLRKYVYK